MKKINLAAFIFPQEITGGESVMNYLKTVDEIKRRSKLDFFREMEDVSENKLEKDENREWATKRFSP